MKYIVQQVLFSVWKRFVCNFAKMFTIIVLVLISVVSGMDLTEDENLFEGDIIMDKEPQLSAVPKDNQLWPDGIIPYTLDEEHKSNTDVIHEAMKKISDKSCIRFKERTDEADYVKIKAPEKGCSSHIGKATKGGEQSLKLGPKCLNVGTVIHELMHTIGFYHEHTRSDRDKFVKIYKDNIKEEEEYNFEKLDPSKERLLNDFDYDSIMIYGEDTFTDNGENTMEPKKKGVELIKPKKKTDLSESDVKRVNILYSC